MGLVASQARLLMLTSRMSDLEFMMQQISQQRIMLTNAANTIAMQQIQGMNLAQNASNPLVNPAANAQQAQQAQADAYNRMVNYKLEMIHNIDKNLETQLQQYTTQHKAAETEVESVKKIIDKNIEMTFKYVS